MAIELDTHLRLDARSDAAARSAMRRDPINTPHVDQIGNEVDEQCQLAAHAAEDAVDDVTAAAAALQDVVAHLSASQRGHA